MLMTGLMCPAGHLAEQHGTDAESAELWQNADRVQIELPSLGLVIQNSHSRIIFTDYLEGSLTKRYQKRAIIAAQRSRQLAVDLGD